LARGAAVTVVMSKSCTMVERCMVNDWSGARRRLL
jgi:hypothetical protein